MDGRDAGAHRGFNPVPLILVVLTLSVMISLWANWYSDHVSIPRYCGDEEQTLVYLQRILRDKEPAGDEARRPYIVAAKLLFIVPRERAESEPDYLQRVRRFLLQRCR